MMRSAQRSSWSARGRGSRVRGLFTVFAALAGLVALAPTDVAAAPSVESRLRPTDPVRVLDTRTLPSGRVRAGGTVDVPVGDLPAGATAVVLNVTVVGPAAPGFITAYAGPTRPPTSNANTDEVGEIAANLVVVPLGGRSDVHIYSSSETDLVVDLLGTFVPAAGSSAGRFRTVEAATARVLDTRTESPAPTSVGAGRILAVRGRAGVPSTGVGAVALNVTVTETVAPGWLQVIPTGGTTAAGASSNVNVARAGQTVANLVIVPVGSDGSVTLAGTLTGQIVVDVAGWFTDATAASGTDGLFVAVDPARLADTRTAGGPPAAGATVPVPASAPGIDPARLGAVLTNLTLTEAAAPGYVTGWSGAGGVPAASSINADKAGATVANAAIVATNGGSFALFTQQPAHLVVDLLGWFTRSAGSGAPPGAGAIVRTSQVSSGARIVYRSVGAAGALTQQVTLAYVPPGTPPAGGWPIMAIVHGPYGMGDQCAVSIGTDTRGEAQGWLARGYAVVLPDLEGIGVDSPGDHPYMHGPATARSMLDAVRAARTHFGAVLSNKVVSWGFSSGAHGSLFVGEYAAEYAPEIDMRGVVSLDPVSVLTWQVSGAWSQLGFAPWWIQGQHAGDPTGLPYSEVLKPEAIPRMRLLNEGCMNDVWATFDDIPGGALSRDPMTLPNWAAAFRASDPGSRRSAPVLVAGGNRFSGDIPAYPHDQHQRYIDQACALGTSVHFQVFEGGHMAMIEQTATDYVYAWVAARIRGDVQTGCTKSGP